MSVRGDITDWVAAQLRSEIAYLRDVFAVGSPTEFERLRLNLPAAAVYIERDERAAIEQQLYGGVYVTFAIQVIFACDRFRADTGAGITDQHGAYELFDDIHAAIGDEVPTGCAEPLAYANGSIMEVEDGMVLAVVEYQTAQLIT